MSYGYYGYPQFSTTPVNGLVSVTGIEGAKAYQLPPNSSVALFDANEDIMYIKSTDGAGFPTVRPFRFEPIEQKPQPTGITREEFDALVAKVDALAPTRKVVSDAE